MGGPIWRVLSGLPAWEITQIPRHGPQLSAADSQGGWPDRGVSQRVQALAAACRQAAPVAFGWVRSRADGPVRMIAAGPGLTAASDSGQAVLTVPAGARGNALAAGRAAAEFAAIGCWTPVAVIADALLAGKELASGSDGTTGQVAPSLEDGLLGSWPRPFGWIVVAEPRERSGGGDDQPGVAGAAERAAA
jgi:uncharacterized protein